MGGLLYLMTSCLGSDDKITLDDWALGNAQIATFTLSHDSIAGLSGVRFTIDQLNGTIYNKDSMPFGTVIEEKVLCKLSFDSPYDIAAVLFVQPLTNDSVWGTNDSIDFSSPVIITVYPLDGVSEKTYEAKVNIHQIKPDSMVWHKYTSLISGKTFKDMKVISYNNSYYMYVSENGVCSLYESDTDDMINWKEIPLSGFPADADLSQVTEFDDDLYVISKQGGLYYSSAGQNSATGQIWTQVDNAPSVKALLGYLPQNPINGRAAIISGIIAENDVIRFASMTNDREWKTGTVVPETFPISGYSGFNYESMHHPRIIIASGRDSKNGLSNKAWSTMDGLSWVSMSNDIATFSPREGAAVSLYDNCFFLVGGLDASGKALSDIYYSKDYGVTWSDTMYVMPENYPARGFSSVIVDKNNYMLLFGGKAGKDTNILSELWRGRINRLGFGKE